jgi:hypothetical protein
MVHHLYLILVVLFRTLGLLSIASSTVSAALAIILGGAKGTWPFLLVSVGPFLAGGVILWLLAKPIAHLITCDLH